MPLPFTARRTDPDAAAFCARSGASDRAALSAFVRGVKDLGLWQNMVCWPLRSTQNAGTGTTAYSLGGLGAYNGTLVDGPSWGTDGLLIDATTERMTTGYTPTSTSAFMGAAFKLASTGTAVTRLWTADVGGTLQGLGFDGFEATQFRRLSSAFAPGVGTQSTNWTFLSVGGGPVFFAQDTSSTVGASTDLTTPFGELRLGFPAPTGTRLGDYAFLYWMNQAVVGATYSAFYTLYKQTLGTGLGLP